MPPSSPARPGRTIPPIAPVGANVDACANASTPGSSSTNAPNSATRVTRPVRTWPTSYVAWTSRPRIGGELLQPEGDLLLVLVDAQDLDGDLVAGLDDLRRVRHAGPPHLGHVQQALHAAAQVDERAELAHRGDAPGHDRAGDDRSPDLGGARALLLLEKRTPRDDEVPAAFLVLDDPELVDMPFVRRTRPSGGCRSERSGRRRAGGRCAPRTRPSPPVRPCLPPEDRCGTRLRAAARSRPLAPASARASALPRSTPPWPECGRRRRPRDRPRRPSVRRCRSWLRPCRRRRQTPPPDRSRRSCPRWSDPSRCASP